MLNLIKEVNKMTRCKKVAPRYLAARCSRTKFTQAVNILLRELTDRDVYIRGDINASAC